MITDPQFRAARALLNKTSSTLAEASGQSELAMLCGDQADGEAAVMTNNRVKLQRVIETAAMVSIDGDAAIGAGVRLRRP